MDQWMAIDTRAPIDTRAICVSTHTHRYRCAQRVHTHKRACIHAYI